MSRSETATSSDRCVYREYILDVRVVELAGGDESRYRFEAPRHRGVEFEDPETAELYADIYFDVNGFEEAGTGERGLDSADPCTRVARHALPTTRGSR